MRYRTQPGFVEKNTFRSYTDALSVFKILFSVPLFNFCKTQVHNFVDLAVTKRRCRRGYFPPEVHGVLVSLTAFALRCEMLTSDRPAG